MDRDYGQKVGNHGSDRLRTGIDRELGHRPADGRAAYSRMRADL